MKINTLLEFQKCFDLLKRAEAQREKLAIADYLAVISAECQFRSELVADLKDRDVGEVA